MPGSVQLCTVQGGATVALPVMPAGLAAAWTEIIDWPMEFTDPYPDGSQQQRSLAATGPRRSWALARLLNAADMDAFVDFYVAQRGGVEPFYFYPLLADWDETGVSVTGRYTVRFEGGIGPSWALGRSPVEFRLIEVS